MTRGANAARTLGILGGMGPAATVDVLDKIVRATPATHDQEHIPIVVHCIPQIPDRTEALLGRGPSPEDALVQGAAALRRAGAEVLAIACNTAHHWYAPIREAFEGPVVHIARAVIHQLRENGFAGPVGILATRGTMLSGFYRDHLDAAGYVMLAPPPDSQAIVDHAIARAKAGDLDAARPAAREAADALFRRGAGRVLLACTELPVVLGGAGHDGDFIDANQALAHACIRAAHGTHDDMPDGVRETPMPGAGAPARDERIATSGRPGDD